MDNMRTKQQLIKYAKDHEMPRRTVYQIKIDGKYIRKDIYRGYKRVWSNRGAAWQALQMIVGAGDYKEKVNPVIQSYIDEGFIEIVEV
jgi:hypothetical protein